MTKIELQELSRDAAKALPTNPDWPWFSHEDDNWRDGRIVEDKGEGRMCWLHESTEACTEIMVRVLNGSWTLCKDGTAVIHSYPDGTTYVAVEHSNQHGNDPMLAFRAAVLRALIALEKK
jgi:hypothetical protein